MRLLVTLADGMTRGSVEALAAAVDDAEAGGTVVLGIGIGDDTVAAAYSRHRVVERPDALAQAMVDGVRAALRRSIALSGGDHVVGPESRLYDEPDTEEGQWLRKITFVDPTGEGPPVELAAGRLAGGPARRQATRRQDPAARPVLRGPGDALQAGPPGAGAPRARVTDTPLHVALRGHMGTGKDHDLEQFAALLGLPYYRIPLTGEVRDITLIGSVKLHGDGRGGTESRWEDGDITRALRGPALINMSELNAAGAETLFALHGLLDRYQALDLPTGETVRLRPDIRLFGTLNPTDLRDYAGTQTLNKAFADRWVIWEKRFPTAEQIEAMLTRRYPTLRPPSSPPSPAWPPR